MAKYMPNKDKTGPLGEGPLTGRGLGPCGNGEKRGRLGLGQRSGFGRRANQRSASENKEKDQD